METITQKLDNCVKKDYKINVLPRLRKNYLKLRTILRSTITKSKSLNED